MAKLRRARAHMLVVALWLGAFLLLSCQPAQPVATPKPAEKAAATAQPAATPAKPAETPVAAATKPAEKAAEKPIRGGTLRVSYWGVFETLDMRMGGTNHPVVSIYDLLIQPDVGGNLTKEGLFKDWTIGGDGKSITFKLQGGVKFHDGTDLDAAAVKWNIEALKDPATKSAYGFNYASVASVEVVDSLTVRFNLKQPDPLLLPSMASQAGKMVSPTAVQKLGQDFGRKPVGSGPFQVVEFVSGDHITLKRFDGYWQKDQAGNQLPYLDGVVFKIITDPTVALANLRTGQVDIYDPPAAGLPPEQLPIVKGDANLTYLLGVSTSMTGLYLNTKKPPFDNKALRQAVALALDREGIAGLLGETGIPQASILHRVTWAYDGKAGVSPARDVAKAKAKMAEAGSPSGLKGKATTMNNPNLMRATEIMKANLAEIGIDVEIQVVEVAVWQSKVAVVGGDYQMSIAGVTGMSDPGHLFGLFFNSKGSRNYSGPYSNPQVDQLVDKAGSIYDQGERTTLYRQAANIMADEAPFVPLYVVNEITPLNKKVRDYNLGVTHTIHLGRTWLAK